MYKRQQTLSNRALSSFNKNKERDLAIIALLLASGVRLSEAVNLDLRDLNLKMMVIDVTRKGGKRDSVNVAAFAKPYLEQYLTIRDKRYKTEKTDTALFLTLYRGVPNRIDASSVEKMVAKYSEDFKVRVTPHKLRHTLATRLYDATKSQVLVSHQLGHASTQVTDLYTHIAVSYTHLDVYKRQLQWWTSFDWLIRKWFFRKEKTDRKEARYYW